MFITHVYLHAAAITCFPPCLFLRVRSFSVSLHRAGYSVSLANRGRVYWNKDLRKPLQRTPAASHVSFCSPFFRAISTSSTLSISLFLLT